MDDRDLRWRAVERAYRDHADDVYRVAFAILRDPDAAVDATQDTFARAFDRWDQYDANRPLRAWLHGIVSHAALDALRRRRIRTLSLPAIGLVREISVAGGVEGDPADRVVERDQMAGVMRELKPDVRAAPRAPPLLRLRLRRDRRLPPDQSGERRIHPQPSPRLAPCAIDHGHGVR
jgi:RNA polymerase sigma factor (sigma-70 family)